MYTIKPTVHSLGKVGGDVGLVEAVAGGQDRRPVGLLDEGVNDIEEAIDAIRVVLTDGDESGRDVSRDTDGVLNVQGLEEIRQRTAETKKSAQTYSLGGTRGGDVGVAAIKTNDIEGAIRVIRAKNRQEFLRSTSVK